MNEVLNTEAIEEFTNIATRTLTHNQNLICVFSFKMEWQLSIY